MRKALSFVLVLTLVLSSFSMAFAATPAATAAGLSDIAGIANEEAIQVAYDLGIVTGNPDGTFLPTKAVTRAEFAAMITRALAIPDSALAGYTATSFKDTAGYGWAVPYLAFANSKGIMLGDGAGNAMPGRTINMNEAITMALRAVGYTANSNELVGAWPSNYVSVAQNNSMYSDVANVTNVDKANAAQIIYNALTVQKVAVNADGDTNFLTIADPDDSSAKVEANLLNTGLDCYGRDGIVAYDQDSKISLTQYVGAKATIYKDDGGDGDIVAVKPISTFLTGKFENYYGKFKADGVEYKYPTSATSIAGIVNCDVTTLSAVGATASALTATDESVTLAVKVSGKTITDVYSLTSWQVTDDIQAASDIQDEIADDQAIDGNDFALDDNDEIDLSKVQLVGVPSLDKIAEDDVVYLYQLGGSTTADIVKVAVGTDTVSGTVTKKDGTKYTIGGTVYKKSADAAVTSLTVGTDYDVVLDAYGEIYDATETSNNTDTYGVVLATASAGIDDARVKMYLSTDETKTFYVDGDEVAVPPATTAVAIGYGLNADGKIDAVEDSITADNATMTGVKTLYVTKGAVGTKYAIASDAVVFTMNASGDCDISSVGKVDLNESLNPTGHPFSFILNDDDEVVAMVVNSGAASRDADDVYAVVNGITEVWNATDEDTVNEITALVDGAEIVKTATSDSVGDGSAGVGLIKITYDGDGVIKTATNAGIVPSSFTFDKLNTAKDSIHGTDNNWYDVNTAKLVVYEKTYDTNGEFDVYVKSSLSKIQDAASVDVYNTDSDAGEEGYEVVIWEE